MKTPAWLAELHRQWMAARGRRVESAAKSFRRDWEQLLDDAGLHSAEDRQAAVREAEKMPQLVLHRRKGREYQVLKIELSLEAETWLHAQFGSQTGGDLQTQSLRALDEWTAHHHPVLPELWSGLMQSLNEAFTAVRVLGPFNWREPEWIEFLLRLLFDLTSREWPEGTLVRDASTTLGHDSKSLETQQSFIERALEQLFGRETPLEALGIQTSNSVLHYSGPLTLHFKDGSTHRSDTLKFEASLSIAELDRATRITTMADRVLTVENRKTTFLQLARADAKRTTLLIATSFPTQAVRLLLEKLPLDFPHHHFGDTDPSGWDILRCLRETISRPVHAFGMKWRPSTEPKPLTKRDLQIINRLLADSRMVDCHPALLAMRTTGMRGDFEQETLGPPNLPGWPFYKR